MFNSSRTWMAILFVVLQFGVYTVSAMIGCAAEANFQGCKTIHTTTLNGCGPVDYSCQCNAQNLIQQCYNLCPEYSIDANEQARVATGICAAVPTTSRPPVVSQTWWPPSSTESVSTPTASSQPTPASFSVHDMSPSTSFMYIAVFLAGLLQL